MDNTFEVIVFIIFIALSMLGSLSKDKKKKQQQKSGQNPQRGINQKSPTKSYDDLFMQKESSKNSDPFGEQTNESFDTMSWNPEKEYNPNKDYKKKFQSPDLIGKETTLLKKQESKEKSKVVSQIAQNIQQIKTFEPKTKANRFRELTRNPQNLADYIIVSEILGKPKAFRR